MKLSRIAPASVLALTLAVAACSDDNGAGPELTNIVQTAISAGSFETLVAAVDAAGVGPTLANEGPFTVFAPTDDAFAKLPASALNALLLNTEALTEVLFYHVLVGELPAADVVDLTAATTYQGADLTIDVSSSGVKINDANVIQTDIKASNGIIHVIDAVLIPPQ